MRIEMMLELHAETSAADLLAVARGLPQSSEQALTRLRAKIDSAANFVAKGWTANKIAAYFDVTEVDLLRELRRAGKKLPQEAKQQTLFNRQSSTKSKLRASPDAVRRIKKVLAAGDVDQVIADVSSWFGGLAMGLFKRTKSTQDRRVSSMTRSFKALRAGYPIKARSPVFRCTLVKLK